MGLFSTSCLILEPVSPDRDDENEPPEFFFVNPDNGSPYTIDQSSSTPVTFTAKANDKETARAKLLYTWFLDGNPVIEETPAADDYTTSGTSLAIGEHELLVLVVDDGQPAGSSSLQWEIVVQ